MSDLDELENSIFDLVNNGNGGHFIARPIEAISTALSIITKSGGVEEAHHKAWVIDQVVRCLTECPIVECTAINAYGKEYKYLGYGESELYKEWRKNYNQDGYEWNEGVAP